VLKLINETWDNWLDDFIDRNFCRILAAFLIFCVAVVMAATGLVMHWAVMRSVEAQLYLRDLDIKTIRQQQEANQRDINRLIAEEFYIKEQIRGLRR
jgi:signal transduction histidine kinase